MNRMLHYCFTFSILFVLVIKISDGANILGIFPTPSYSHQQPMLAISLGLAKKGHNVTVITTDPTKTIMENYTEIDARSTYNVFKKLEEEVSFNLQMKRSAMNVFSFFDDIFTYITRAMLEDPNVIKYMKTVRETNTTYDLVMIETFQYTSFLGLIYQGKKAAPPVVGLSTISLSAPTDVDMGNPLQLSYVPALNTQFTNRMTFFERIENVITAFYHLYVVKYCVMASQQKIMNEYFGYDLPTVDEIERNRSLQIIATDLATSFMRPLHPNTILIGQTHLTARKQEPLPKDLQKWLDEAEDGVIYFSLGSNMQGKSVPEHKRKAFIDTFRRFPKTRVLWKWESDAKLPGQPDNVLTRKWLPQKSILAHPNVRLFISQVGLQSMQEAIHFAVPMLGVPMFGDQEYNTYKLLSEGAGLRLAWEEIDFNTVHQNINSMLSNQSFKKNILRLQKIAADRPMSSIETAVWWIEYVLRHDGAPHLRSVALDLAWYQLYMVDIIAFVISILAVVVVLTYFVIRKFCFYSKTSAPKLKTK